MEKEVIKLDKVWKTYLMGRVEVNALQGVDLAVKRGDFLAIVGPSGSGKSTMMNLVGALDIPTKGTIYLDDKDISKLSESNLAQIRGKKIGFIFQQFNLMPILNAMENVMLPMTFLGVERERSAKMARRLLTLVGLGKRITHKPSELSGGEQQRVAIARALANDPEVILADEPTGNLDSKTGIEIMNLLGKLHEEKKKTIIMVTHDISLVKYAHKTVHLRDGKIERIINNHKD